MDEERFEEWLTPPDVKAVHIYLRRAQNCFNWAFAVPSDKLADIHPEGIAACTAFCLHACISASEVLARITGTTLEQVLRTLAHGPLVKRMRDDDVHNRPIPACPVSQYIQEVRTGRQKMTFSAEPGEGIQVQFPGPTPIVTISDAKKVVLSPGESLSYAGRAGALWVFEHDKGAERSLPVKEALGEFLRTLQGAIDQLAPSQDS